MKESSHDLIHDFFHTASKAIIVLPIFIVLITLIFTFSARERDDRDIKSFNTILSPTPINSSEDKVNFDLAGPSVCEFKTKTASWSASIQNNRVKAVEYEKGLITHYLLKEDCFFSWKQGAYTGLKTCGIGVFVTTAVSLLNSGFMSDDLFDMLLSKSGSSSLLPLQFNEIKKAISTCAKKNIPLPQFDLPKQVLFKSR